MADEWQERTIADIATVVGGGTPSTKDPDNFNGEIPWLTPKDLSGYPFRYISRGERNISQQGYDSSNAKFVPKGSVLLTTRAPVGYVAIASNPVTTNQGFHSLVLKDSFHSEFVYYLLKSHTDYLRAHATGTTYGELSGSALNRLKFRFPPLTDQQAIACILGALDDKIELNRRMNETLEQIAQAIFKQWFIEPTRDGLPEGWRQSTVDQEFNLTMGQSPPGETYNERGDGTPFFQGRADFGFRYPKRRVFCTAPTRFAEAGDTLVSVRAPVGSINMAAERCAVGRGVAAIRHKSESRSFTYYFMRSLESVFSQFEAEGTVFGSITKADFHKIEFVAPPERLVDHFEQLVFPIDQRIENNETQSDTLAALRDALLPKLISGELRVPDAEKVIGRVGA